MPSSRIADRLSAARRIKLVGRAAELALFRDALAAPGPLPFFVLYVFGPGGVGKTTLLSAFGAAARDANMPAALLDARNVEPTPEAFLAALGQTLAGCSAPPPVESSGGGGGGDDDDPLACLGGERRVLLIDTYENLEPLDGYLRDTFLPRLSDNTLVVLAGRVPPSPGWRGDLGWQNMVKSVSLRNLSPAESRTFLEQRAVPAAQHPAVLDFTHGHPLALSLVADLFDQKAAPSDGDAASAAESAPIEDLRAFVPQAAPDVIQTLVERFVRDVPGPAHRAALEICALVRLTTEDLLARLLREADEPGLLAGLPDGAHALFDWLCHLGFIERGRRGLFPHDLAREALLADLRWRNPERYATLHARARDFYSCRHRETAGAEQQRVLFDFMFLHRDSQVVRGAFAWHDSANLITDETLRPTDVDALVAMTSRQEGEESADLLRGWLAEQPQNALVFRDASSGEPAGFTLLLALTETRSDKRDADPATRAAWHFLRQQAAPLRPGEAATHFRFWMARDTYQAVSPVQSLVIVNIVRRCLTIPGLAYTFFPVADPDSWAPLFAYAEMRRIPEADFCVGGKTYGVFGNDWRVLSPTDWLALLARKETAGDQGSAATTAAPNGRRGDTLLVLSEPEFASAVRDALRHFSQPRLLESSPLLRSRVVAVRLGSAGAGSEERRAALRDVLREGAESLQASPRTAKGYQSVRLTYLEPAASQEQAADLLDLPFSTYRRHLAAGVAEITHRLWLQEIGANGGAATGEK